MEYGIALPHIGPEASAAAIIDVARRAESLGFGSVWVLDRLLYPLISRSKYPGNPSGAIPRAMRITYEPLTVLAFAAAVTEKILLGTSVLVASYRSPVLVAKMAATLDQLSGGRLILGLGAGWSGDEFSAIGETLENRQERTDEYLRVLKSLWTEEQPAFSGKFYRVPEAIFLPRPAQRTGPPLWIGGNSERAMRRAAELGDSWHPTSRIGLAKLAEGMKYVRATARRAGRDPEAVKLTLRWNASPFLTQKFSAEKAREQLSAFQQAGVAHVCIDLNIPEPSSVGAMLESMERLARDVFPKV